MNTGSAIITIERELASIVGAEYLHERATELAHHAIDGIVPEYIVEPGSEEEVAAVMRLANQRKLKIYPAGGFTAQGIGRAPARVDILLKTARLNAIEHYDPGDLTIGVGAGATVKTVREILGGNHQLLPVEVEHPVQSTIGGTLARAAHGPLRHAYGGVRDFCIGLRFVTGDGRLAKSGGRVVKNVAGYDLMKLLIGSHGTLAVITAANFKVHPAPRQTRTWVADFESAQQALAFRDRVLHSPLGPMSLDIASPLAQEFLFSHSDDSTWRVMVRAGGSDTVLSRYARELGSPVTHVFDGRDDEAYWNSVVEFAWRVGRCHQNAMVVGLSAAPSELASALENAERVASENNFLLGCVGRCAVAAMQLAFIPLPQGAPVVTQYALAVEALRQTLAPDATCVVTHSPPQVKQHLNVWGTPPAALASMKAVKHALDQNDVLNCGRFIL